MALVPELDFKMGTLRLLMEPVELRGLCQWYEPAKGLWWRGFGERAQVEGQVQVLPGASAVTLSLSPSQGLCSSSFLMKGADWVAFGSFPTLKFCRVENNFPRLNDCGFYI